MRPVLILIFLLFSAFPAAAANQDDTLQYGLYAGGIRALDVTMRFQRTAKTYGISMQAKPEGVIGSLLPWAGTYTTKGVARGLTLIPQTHRKLSQWREDKDQDSFVYNQKGVLVSLKRIDTEKKPVREEIVPLDPALHRDAVDLLSGAMWPITRLNAGKSCDGSVVVFDGKRRYTLQFTAKGHETLSKSQYNRYAGDAVICQIELIPLAGFKGKKRGYYKLQEEGRAQGQMPKIWFGRLSPKGSYVPVKIFLKAEYGAILAHVEKRK